MDPKARKRHLHASVAAASLYGMAIGLWIGARGGHAGWIESAIFIVVLMFAPGIVLSRIDAKFDYSD